MSKQQHDPAAVAAAAEIVHRTMLLYGHSLAKEEIVAIIRTAYAEQERQHAEVVKRLSAEIRELREDEKRQLSPRLPEWWTPKELNNWTEEFDAETERLVQAAKEPSRAEQSMQPMQLSPEDAATIDKALKEGTARSRIQAREKYADLEQHYREAEQAVKFHIEQCQKANLHRDEQFAEIARLKEEVQKYKNIIKYGLDAK